VIIQLALTPGSGVESSESSASLRIAVRRVDALAEDVVTKRVSSLVENGATPSAEWCSERRILSLVTPKRRLNSSTCGKLFLAAHPRRSVVTQGERHELTRGSEEFSSKFSERKKNNAIFRFL
jgi:hypothetical protein